MNSYQKKLIAVAIQSIITEAKSYPCFGLVSKYDSGCHKNMNLDTFLVSAKSFQEYFQEIISLVEQDDSLNFNKLRELAKQQEIRMYQATNNVNTHKGLIFHYGIIFYIISYQNNYHKSFESYPSLIKDFVEPLKLDFAYFKNETKGQQLYHKYKIMGARGMALSGYEIVFNKGLPFLKTYQRYYPNLNQEQLALLLLVFYLSEIEDTTLISKIGYQKSKEIAIKAKQWLNLLEKKGYDSFYQVILINNNQMKQQKVSPGGCADLVVITLFLAQVLDEK